MVLIWKLNPKPKKSYETKIDPSKVKGIVKGTKDHVAMMEAIVYLEKKEKWSQCSMDLWKIQPQY